MIRLLAILVLAVPLLWAAPHAAQAQVCSPACGAGKTCIWVGEGKDTECIDAADCTGDACEVDEIIITAPSKGETPKPETTTGSTPKSGGGISFADLVYKQLVPLGDTIISLLYALAFVFFLIGVFRFFFTQDAEQRQKGKTFMLWSLIVLVVLFSVWGFVKLLLSILPGTGV